MNRAFFVHSKIMFGAQVDWCSPLHSLSSKHYLSIFSFRPHLPIANSMGEFMEQGIHTFCFSIKATLWSFQRLFFPTPYLYFPLLLMMRKKKCCLPGNACLLICLMVVVMKIEIRMTLNPCTILYLYFNYICNQGLGQTERKVVRVMWIWGRLSNINTFWISSTTLTWIIWNNYCYNTFLFDQAT